MGPFLSFPFLSFPFLSFPFLSFPFLSHFLSTFYILKSTRGFCKFSSPQFYILQSTKRSTFPLHNSTSFNLPRHLHFLSTILHPSIYQEIYISSPQFYNPPR